MAYTPSAKKAADNARLEYFILGRYVHSLVIGSYTYAVCNG